MPRTRRSFGRPGTPVIPRDWEANHAPVAKSTQTGKCTIHAPAGGPDVRDETDGLWKAPAGALRYDDSCRLQALGNQARVELLGAQNTKTLAYLLSIDYAASSGIRVRDLVRVTESNDASLEVAGRTFYVAAVSRGTLRWERDLIVVDDLSFLGAA